MANKASVLEQDPSMVETAINKGGKKATLRLKQNGSAVVEEVVSINCSILICKSLDLLEVFDYQLKSPHILGNSIE